jgi:glycogen debranching enzyme
VPSYDPRDEKFDSKRYWRGPVWAVMNMLIGIGMEEFNMDEGRILRQNTTDLITDHGFAEYFDPHDGSPAGGESFTWTAAVWLGWASPSAINNH